MADPFEVRMRFSSQLQHLNASVSSAQKAAQYAIKYRDMDEDLHSCIVEQIEKNSMNTRANIMFFIEHFLDLSTKERGENYVRMMQRDILRIVDAVCPEDGSGAANVKVVRKVINGLTEKTILSEQVAADIEGCLKERDTSAADVGFSSPVNGGDAAPSTGDTSQANGRSRNGTSATSGPRLDKRQIEQRIEEDRERHKRARESMWTVSSSTEEQGDNLFDNTSEIGDDDHVLGDEDSDMLIAESKGVECSHNAPDHSSNGARPR